MIDQHKTFNTAHGVYYGRVLAHDPDGPASAYLAQAPRKRGRGQTAIQWRFIAQFINAPAAWAGVNTEINRSIHDNQQ